jgi:hypothetical protein
MIAGGVWQLLVVEDVVARQAVALIIEFHLAVGQIWNRVKCISQTVERRGFRVEFHFAERDEFCEWD